MAIDWEVSRQYKAHLDDGDLPGAIAFISEKMRELPQGPFDVALELEITSAPEKVAAWFRSCLAAAGEVEPVRAAYVELNGFDINTDVWYFDFLAFREDPGFDDGVGYSDGWHWASEESFSLEGLEPLQRVFADNRELIRTNAGVYAALLVLLKYFALVDAATKLLSPRDFPLAAGATNDEDRLVIR